MLTIPQKMKRRRECRQRKNQIINGLLNNYDKETKTDDNVTFNDCIKGPADIVIRGKKISQEVRSGKNRINRFYKKMPQTCLSPVTGFEQTWAFYDEKFVNEYINGFTIKIKAKNPLAKPFTSVVLGKENNTTTTDAWSKRVYFGSFSSRKSNDFTIYEYYATNIDFTLISDHRIIIIFEDATQQTGCDLCDIEIDLGNTVGEDFEAYGQCPSKDYPSEIEYVEGNQTVEHANKNLLKEENKLINMSIMTGGKIEISQDNYLFYIPVEYGKKYISTCKFKDELIYPNMAYGYTAELPALGVNCTFNLIDSNNLNKSIYSPPENSKYLCFRINYNLQLPLITDFMVEEIPKATTNEEALQYQPTDYVPHQSKTYQLSNLPPLYSENDKIVYLNKNNPKASGGAGWYFYNKWIKIDFSDYIVFDHSDGWENQTCFTLPNAIYHGIAGYTTKAELYCNRLEVATPAIIAAGAMNKIGLGSNNVIFFSIEGKTSIADYVEYFRDNPTYLIAPLEEPTYTKITDEILIEQLDKLRSLLTYEGKNHFIVTSENGQACNLEVTVYKNSIKIMQKEIDNLKALVLES